METIIPAISRLLNVLVHLPEWEKMHTSYERMVDSLYPSAGVRNQLELSNALREVLGKITVFDIGLNSDEMQRVWMEAEAALNGEEEEEEEIPIEILKGNVRALLRSKLERKEFERLLQDAVHLMVSEEELRNALQFVIDVGGSCVRPITDFLESCDRDEDYPEEYDDEDAATRLLFNTVTSPDFPEFIQAHPEAMNFLL